ncbi:MAG: DUF4351 domain-containing protein [Opitutaceae bacterium]|jgi:hypothetical protein|nr:DUF4351 domain-containing protein [Opitutaceae bacterium]
MGNRKECTTDYDGAWKEALEIYLRPFLGLCFPEVARGIDWKRKPEFLDQELQQITRDSELGRQRVDKLVKVWRDDGEAEVILLHLEVQGQPEDGLALRMYQYHHRIVDRFGRRTVSMAILADTRKGWKPSVYEEGLWGMRKQDILELFRLIDWLITLPRELELAFRQDLVNYEKEKTMPYITSIERLGREEGLQEGLEEGRQKGRQEGEMFVLQRLLRRRFGDLPGWVRERLTHASTEELEAWSERILDAVILEDVFS